MPSNNLRNNELEFTPTFGTQHYFDIADLLIYLALGATYLMKFTLTNKNKPTRRNT